MHPTEQIDKINQVLDVLGDTSGNGIQNFDAVQAISKILGRKNEWNSLSDNTALKRKLKKNSVTI